MKILIVTAAFYPENSPRSIRATELAKALAEQKHQVTVVSPVSAETIRLSKEFGFSCIDMGWSRFKYLNIPSNRFGNIFFRLLSRLLNLFIEYPEIGWYFNVKKALKSLSGYDMIISIAVPYPIHWGVASVRTKSNPIAKVWVADCGDPYFGLKNDSFKKLFYFKYIEQFFCRKADYITIPIEEARECYFKEFHDKIKVIPQGFYFPNIESNSPALNGSKVVLCYTGNIRSYMHYAVPFLELLSSIEMDFEFILYTEDSVIFDKLDQYIPHKYKRKNYVDRFELYKEVKQVNFFVHFPYQKHGQQSLKLIDYTYMGKPILSFDNTDESIKCFREFMNGNYQGAFKLSNPEKFRIENVVQQFLDLAPHA
jgi:glycosyltransferase involved in cell wall biosynthesis